MFEFKQWYWIECIVGIMQKLIKGWNKNCKEVISWRNITNPSLNLESITEYWPIFIDHNVWLKILRRNYHIIVIIKIIVAN